jgi:trimethylamine--corrinoid protein Co-methyltransferase
VVRAALATCPPKAAFGWRYGASAVVGEGEAPSFWPGNALYLVDGKERRPIGGGDFARLTRLADRLDHAGAMVGVAVSDFAPPTRDFRTLRLMAAHTRKHLRPVITSPAGIEAVLAMAEVLNDGGPDGAPRVSFGYSVVSPLRWNETALALFAKTSGHRYPLMLNAEPMAGATSPVTLAGSLAQANAETLSGIVIAQALEPGRPCLHNVGFAHVFDMRTAVALCGSVEVFLMGAAGAALARHYGLPSCSWVSTEALTEDAQAGYEKGMGYLLHAACGVNLVWGLGQLESQLSISAEQMVIDDEIAAQALRARAGVAVDAGRLDAAILEDLGGAEEILSHPHTLAWFRRELTEARVGNRERRRPGAENVRRRAQEQLEALLAREWEPVMDETASRELERIEQRFRRVIEGDGTAGARC